MAVFEKKKIRYGSLLVPNLDKPEPKRSLALTPFMPPTIYEPLNPEPLNPWTVTVLLAGYTPSEGLNVTQ